MYYIGIWIKCRIIRVKIGSLESIEPKPSKVRLLQVLGLQKDLNTIILQRKKDPGNMNFLLLHMY